MMNEKSIRLLWAAALMLAAGAIFALLGRWTYAVLLAAGALGCAVGAWNGKNGKEQ